MSAPEWILFIWDHVDGSTDVRTKVFLLPRSAISSSELAMLRAARCIVWNDDDDRSKTESNFRALYPLSKRFNMPFHDVDWLLQDGVEDSIVQLPDIVRLDPRLDDCYSQDTYYEVLDDVAREYFADEFPDYASDWEKYLLDESELNSALSRVLVWRCSVTLW